MNSKIAKRLAYFCAASIGAALLAWAVVIARTAWFFRDEVVSDIVIRQRPFEEAFDLVSPRSDVMIKNVAGWIVSPGFLYGSTNDSEYFAVSVVSFEANRFKTLPDLNAFLKRNALPNYDINNEDTVAHLRYNGGVDRKYPMHPKRFEPAR